MIRKEIKERFLKYIPEILFTIFLLTLISFAFNITKEDKITNKEINLSFNIHEYEETCNKWETQEINEIIYPEDKIACEKFCNIAENIKIVSIAENDWIMISTYGMEAFDSFVKNGIYIYETTEDCIYCLNQTESYIYKTEKNICTEMILIKNNI